MPTDPTATILSEALRLQVGEKVVVIPAQDREGYRILVKTIRANGKRIETIDPAYGEDLVYDIWDMDGLRFAFEFVEENQFLLMSEWTFKFLRGAFK